MIFEFRITTEPMSHRSKIFIRAKKCPIMQWWGIQPTYKKISSIFKTGSTLKCCTALGFDFTAQIRLWFSVALYMYILNCNAVVVSFGFQEVIGKVPIDFFFKTCNL